MRTFPPLLFWKSNPWRRLAAAVAAMGFLIFSARGFGANAKPLISDVRDQVIAMNTSTAANYFIVGDNETAFGSLVITATSGNTALVPQSAANLTLGGSLSQRTILVKPAAGQTGVAVITLSVNDGTTTVSSTFTVTVTPTNTAPTLGGLPSFQRFSPVQTPEAVPFIVGDGETPAGSLAVVATSSNTDLVPDANLALGGSGANRSVLVTPIPGRRGTAVIRLRVTDSFGAFSEREFIFSVFDPESANNAIPQPRGLYVLDSAGGTNIGGVSMRDANVSNAPFADGYVLRVTWSILEPADGAFSFTIIDNIFSKLPPGQKLSLLVLASPAPWLTELPGVTTWTAGSPAVTAPLPWDKIAQARFSRMVEALGSHLVGGVALRDHPLLATVNFSPPGLKNGIRRPDEIDIRSMPGYDRLTFQNAMLKHLEIVTENFPRVPVHVGFWTYTDGQDGGFGNVTPWEQLRQAALAEFTGSPRPHVGFWMENLAASRAAAEVDPWTGKPDTAYTAPLFLSQERAGVTFQSLGPWSRPFNAATVDNILNGTPEDGLDYAFNDYQCGYLEIYSADAGFPEYAAEFQRWHEFLDALPHAATTFPDWIANRFTAVESADPAISGPAADPDSDGLPNLLEYALNLDPQKADGVPPLPSAIVRDPVGGQDFFTVTYTRRKLPRDVTYHLESSTDLELWSEGSAFTGEISVADDGNDLTETVTARALSAIGAGGGEFLRLRVTLP